MDRSLSSFTSFWMIPMSWKKICKKPISHLLKISKGEKSLKKVLGTPALLLMGVIIGAGIFILTRVASANYSGPALVVSFCNCRDGLPIYSPLLCGVCIPGAGGRQCLRLQLRYSGGVTGMDHRMGPYTVISGYSGCNSSGVVGLHREFTNHPGFELACTVHQSSWSKGGGY